MRRVVALAEATRHRNCQAGAMRPKTIRSLPRKTDASPTRLDEVYKPRVAGAFGTKGG